MQPSDWENAGAAIDAAPTRNDFERKGKARLQDALAVAVRAFKVGLHLHASGTKPLWENYVYLQSPVTTAAIARQVVDLFWIPLNAHFADEDAHAAKPPKLATSGVTIYERATSLKATFNAHVAAVGLHFNSASGATIAAADAVDDTTLIALSEQLRTKIAGHPTDAGEITFEVVVSASTAAAMYLDALSQYNARVAAAQAAFAVAEPVARAGATALGYAPVPPLPPWRMLFYSSANYSVLIDRLQTLEGLPAFGSHEYATAVVQPAGLALRGAPPPGSAPTPPQGPTVVTRLVGTVNPTAETTLQTIIDNVGEFVAGCSANV